MNAVIIRMIEGDITCLKDLAEELRGYNEEQRVKRKGEISKHIETKRKGIRTYEFYVNGKEFNLSEEESGSFSKKIGEYELAHENLCLAYIEAYGREKPNE